MESCASSRPEQALRDSIDRLQSGDPSGALAAKEAELERLRSELEQARSEPEHEPAPWPVDRETHHELRQRLDGLTAELAQAREEAEAHAPAQEQSQRRLIQLEDQLGEQGTAVLGSGSRPAPEPRTPVGDAGRQPSPRAEAGDRAMERRAERASDRRHDELVAAVCAILGGPDWS
jgi:hypothetical protein